MVRLNLIAGHIPRTFRYSHRLQFRLLTPDKLCRLLPAYIVGFIESYVIWQCNYSIDLSIISFYALTKISLNAIYLSLMIWIISLLENNSLSTREPLLSLSTLHCTPNRGTFHVIMIEKLY